VKVALATSGFAKPEDRARLFAIQSIRSILVGILALGLMLSPPLRAQFHVHAAGSIEQGLPGGDLQGQPDPDHGHGHSHDDDEAPSPSGHEPHNAADHSHESAVAAYLLPVVSGPASRSILIVENLSGPDTSNVGLERPPRLS
jgi:hypothetical protein